MIIIVAVLIVAALLLFAALPLTIGAICAWLYRRLTQ